MDFIEKLEDLIVQMGNKENPMEAMLAYTIFGELRNEILAIVRSGHEVQRSLAVRGPTFTSNNIPPMLIKDALREQDVALSVLKNKLMEIV